MTFNCIIMGAAGRDFHDFLSFFRERPQFRVRCFTAAQIPYIDERVFPQALAGPGYDADIPIYSEQRLVELIAQYDVDFVFLSYSDLAHEQVMHHASTVQAAGASFALLGPRHTALTSKRPVVSVTASRTGAGKSPLSQAIAHHVIAGGRRVGILRHPMPYGSLAKQAVQRFATPADLDAHDCTIEEREEYEPYVARGLTIYAGVDYAAILERAEAESDVILWDGGNNDASFIKADLSFVVLDALRAGHELRYYPGESNFRGADVLVVNKVGSAAPEDVERIRANAAAHNPSAALVESDLQVTTDDPDAIAGKRVLVIEDGPTLTHGGMSYGAGVVAARRFGASELIDPRPGAVGSIADTFAAYPHIEQALPAMGYSDEQRRDLAQTIVAAGPDLVIDASPAGLKALLGLEVPVQRVGYEFCQRAGRSVFDIVDGLLAG